MNNRYEKYITFKFINYITLGKKKLKLAKFLKIIKLIKRKNIIFRNF